MRGIYGQNRYLIGAEPEMPVKLQDVSAGGGMWLGFFAFIGWSVARALDARISEILSKARSKRPPG